MSVYDRSFAEIWNSSAMRNARRALLAGERLPACEVCYQAERNHGVSYRLSNGARDMPLPLDELRTEALRSGYVVDQPPSFVKLELGNLCNLKCRMCFGHASSQIERDPVHGRWSPGSDSIGVDIARWDSEEAEIGPGPHLGVRSIGFYPWEQLGDHWICWTNGAAVLDLPVDRHSRLTALRIEVLPEGLRGQQLRVRVNGRDLFDRVLSADEGKIEVSLRDLEPSRSLEIQLHSSTLQLPGENRMVGIPVTDLKLVRQGVDGGKTDGGGGERLCNRFVGDRDWFQQDSLLFGEILKDGSHLDRLYFTGGEPFLIDRVEQVVDYLIDTGHAHHIELEFSTNCTRIDEAYVEKLSHFRKVFFLLSLDGVGDVYEYIRFPASWEKVRTNIERLIGMRNAELIATPALQAYNALNIVDLCRFFDEMGLDYSLQNFVEHPSHLRIAVLPRAAKALAARRLRDYADGDCRPQFQARVRTVADYIDQSEDLATPEMMSTFMLFTNDLDATRDQRFVTSCPDLFQAISESGFTWTTETKFASRPAVEVSPVPQVENAG